MGKKDPAPDHKHPVQKSSFQIHGNHLTLAGKRQRDLEKFLDHFFEQSSAIRRLEGLE